ncbi:hypothetical protein TNCV_710321 [Trichonephila clavipes]|uniref:Uncharacterized protein n=1 Tax=Trichonephila clavipes TaxID=2585209 RepID=A0A8X6RH89_TRICX|nr:hypothetical protein TNCV_710321 [Trichonephila clavipes]
MSLNLIPLKTRRVGQRCTLNLSRAQTSSRWSSRRGNAGSGVVLVTFREFEIKRSFTKSSRVAEQCDVNIHSLHSRVGVTTGISFTHTTVVLKL